jgi:hypothetical protein
MLLLPDPWGTQKSPATGDHGGVKTGKIGRLRKKLDAAVLAVRAADAVLTLDLVDHVAP